MQIIQPFQAGLLEEVEIGQLLSAVVDGETIIAIKLVQLEGFQSALAVLRGYGEHIEPHIMTITDGLSCASYGSDWVFELIQPEQLLADSDETDKVGTACVARGGTFLKLGRDPSNIRSSGGHLDLSALKFGNIGSPAFAVRTWKVWASAKHRDREDAVPLVDHS